MQNFRDLIAQFLPGTEIKEMQPLAGGVSATMISVTLGLPGGDERRVVIRQPRSYVWKQGGSGPERAAREYQLLQCLQALRLPVPQPRFSNAEITGTLILDFVEGETSLPADFELPMARTLASIHSAPMASIPALPVRRDPGPELLVWHGSMPGFSHALKSCGGTYVGSSKLLHGDFWPGNLVWGGREIAAVLDWEDAASGDPLSDLACARAELTYAAGEEAAEAFTSRYADLALVDTHRLSIWDLYVSSAALDSMDQWGLTPDVLAARRVATERFQLRAFRAIGIEPR